MVALVEVEAPLHAHHRLPRDVAEHQVPLVTVHWEGGPREGWSLGSQRWDSEIGSE